jgi:hypothetical protein
MRVKNSLRHFGNIGIPKPALDFKAGFRFIAVLTSSFVQSFVQQGFNVLYSTQ